MPYPWVIEEGFESGSNLGATLTTNGIMFDVQSPDPFTRAGRDHYTTLAGRSDVKTSPYRGAYCFRIDLATNTTDHYYQETGSLDAAATDGVAVRFAIWISPNIAMANADEFAVFQLWSGASTVEAGIYINFTTANGLRIGIGETSASSFLPISTGVWHIVEAQFLIDSVVPNDGTINGFLDGSAFTAVTGLDQAAITSAVFGVLSQDAGTTAGTILLDEFIGDTAAAAAVARLGPIVTRFPEQMLITRSQHVCVGDSEVQVQMISGAATDNVLTVFDTDTAYVTDTQNAARVINNTVNSEVIPEDLSSTYPIHLRRGAFIELAGSAANHPRAIVKVCRSQGYSSDGRIRQHASNRKLGPIVQ